MTGKHHDLMTINDAEGIMTAQRSDGHDKWPSDYELQHSAMTVTYDAMRYAQSVFSVRN